MKKALEKDRNRRYETASAFAADVRRHPAQEPVEARPPSALYRFSRYARRHRAALTTATLIAATLIAATAVSAWLAVVAWQAEGRATRTAEDFKVKKAEADANAARADGNARTADERRRELQDRHTKLRSALYGGDMHLVQAAWEADDLTQFDQLMQRHAGPDDAD